MADDLPFDRESAACDDADKLLAEYARFFRHVEDCQRDLAMAIDTARAHCARMQRGRFPPDIPPAFLASLLLNLVSDLFKLQSAINGLKSHLTSLTPGGEAAH